VCFIQAQFGLGYTAMWGFSGGSRMGCCLIGLYSYSVGRIQAAASLSEKQGYHAPSLSCPMRFVGGQPGVPSRRLPIV